MTQTHKSIIAGGIAALLVVIGFWALIPKPPVQIVEKADLEGMARQIQDILFGGNIGNTIIALDGVSFSENNRQGAVLRGDGMRFLQGTTTPCTIRSPVTATSSLVSLNIYTSRNATTTAREVSIATSTVPFATTSPILDGLLMAVPANNNFVLSLTPTTTPGGGAQQNSRFGTFSPGTYISVSFKGGNHRMGVGTTTELDGTCSGLFLTEGR